MRQLSQTQILRAGIPSIPWPRKVLVKEFSLGYRLWAKKGNVWPINFLWLLPFWQTFLHPSDAYIFFYFLLLLLLCFFLLMFCFALFFVCVLLRIVMIEIPTSITKASVEWIVIVQQMRMSYPMFKPNQTVGRKVQKLSRAQREHIQSSRLLIQAKREPSPRRKKWKTSRLQKARHFRVGLHFFKTTFDPFVQNHDDMAKAEKSFKNAVTTLEKNQSACAVQWICARPEEATHIRGNCSQDKRRSSGHLHRG